MTQAINIKVLQSCCTNAAHNDLLKTLLQDLRRI